MVYTRPTKVRRQTSNLLHLFVRTRTKCEQCFKHLRNIHEYPYMHAHCQARHILLSLTNKTAEQREVNTNPQYSCSKNRGSLRNERSMNNRTQGVFSFSFRVRCVWLTRHDVRMHNIPDIPGVKPESLPVPRVFWQKYTRTPVFWLSPFGPQVPWGLAGLSPFAPQCEGIGPLGYWWKVNQSPTQTKPYNTKVPWGLVGPQSFWLLVPCGLAGLIPFGPPGTLRTGGLSPFGPQVPCGLAGLSPFGHQVTLGLEDMEGHAYQDIYQVQYILCVYFEVWWWRCSHMSSISLKSGAWSRNRLKHCWWEKKKLYTK